MGISTAINLAKIRMLRGDTLIRAFDADGAPVFTLAVEHKGSSNPYAWQEEWTWHGAWKDAAPKPAGIPLGMVHLDMERKEVELYGSC